MRIAFLTHFYEPEPCAAANRAGALVRALVAAGHQVTVVTNFPSFPQRRLLDANHRFRLFERSAADVEVVRLFTVIYNGPASRLVHWTSAAVASSLYMLAARRRFDAVLVSVPPITLTLPALLAAARHRAKLFVDVRDVYPDVAIAMGKWKHDGLLSRIARFLTGALYRRATLIAAVTPSGVRQIAARNVDCRRLACFPNGCDDVPPIVVQGARAADRFVAIYVGNLGLATDVDVLIDAAAALAGEKHIRLKVVGDGVEGERMRRRAQECNLSNIEFTGAVPRSHALSMTAQADVAIVPLRSGIADSVPSKIFDALCVGCPIIVAADGEAVELTRESGGGVCVPAGDAAALAGALNRMSRLSIHSRRIMGEQGREYVRQFHRRPDIMAGYAARIGSA